MAVKYRILLIAVVALALAPGTWLRSALPLPDLRQQLQVSPLKLAAQSDMLGDLELLGAWQLDSANDHFGGYSALLPLGNGRFLAGSDRGRMLLLSRNGSSARWRFWMGDFAGRPQGEKWQVDLEALTRDPRTGQIWAAYEGSNSIERDTADFSQSASVRPPAMAGWSENAGPEAMTRLADGRFIVLAERDADWLADTSPAVMFAGDPVAGAPASPFRYRAPDGFAPTDMAQLPDGQVLILHRGVRAGLPPRFPAALVIADPAAIRPAGEWSGAIIARIESPLPSDNFEGLAITPHADGRLRVWLISDDNAIQFQRTLLLELALPASGPRAGAKTKRAPG